MYSYESAIDFISNLVFDHITLYSMQRGAAFEEKSREENSDYDKLAARARTGNLDFAGQKRYAELEYTRHVQYLINGLGELHYSAMPTNRFERLSPETGRLITILETEAEEGPVSACVPVYREAIAFYDSQQRIVSSLNICLSCEMMATGPFHHINANHKTYQLLRQFFMDYGHAVEP